MSQLESWRYHLETQVWRISTLNTYPQPAPLNTNIFPFGNILPIFRWANCQEFSECFSMCDCCWFASVQGTVSPPGNERTKTLKKLIGFQSFGIYFSKFPWFQGPMLGFFGACQESIFSKTESFVHLFIAKKKKNTFDATHILTIVHIWDEYIFVPRISGGFSEGPECSKNTAAVYGAFFCAAFLTYHTMPFHGSCYTLVLNS